MLKTRVIEILQRVEYLPDTPYETQFWCLALNVVPFVPPGVISQIRVRCKPLAPPGMILKLNESEMKKDNDVKTVLRNFEDSTAWTFTLFIIILELKKRWL